MSRYAVLDIETTGLSPAHHHRILEVAVVLVDDGGEVVYQWETLVNPERDVTATEIHSLTGADVYRAPTFAQIAGNLTNLLNGRVPVAHNLAFDAPFLAAEYSRIGVSAPLTRADGLCTMRMASRYLSTSAKTLDACCGCIGYVVERGHSALSDAQAAASLLTHYMGADSAFTNSWLAVIVASQNLGWPSLPVGDAELLPRSNEGPTRSDHFLARLSRRTSRSTVHPEADSYLELLDRALLDRRLSHHEQDELVAAAEWLGIGREGALHLHRTYLKELAKIALEDSVLTPDELADLRLVAATLGLTDGDVDAALRSSTGVRPTSGGLGGFALHAGDRIVFTGDEPGLDRNTLAQEAKALGLRVTNAVSGRTDLLVAADPDSLSGKARKARELGVPIVDYRTYLRFLEALRLQT